MNPYTPMVIGVALMLAPIIATVIHPLEEGEFWAEVIAIGSFIIGEFLVGVGVGIAL
jgi:hypothetical protein